MSNGKIEEFKAYLQTLELFDHVVGDMYQYRQASHLKRLVGQQLASLYFSQPEGSVASIIIQNGYPS